VWPHPRGLNFDIVIDRGVLKKSSQEPLDQFQANLVGNMLRRWGFRFVQIKGLIPFGPNKGQNKES